MSAEAAPREPTDALYRVSVKAPKSSFGFFMLPILVTCLVGLLPRVPAWVPLFALPMIALWVSLATLHVTVTRDDVIVKCGIFGPTIPIADIVSTEVMRYDVETYGGFGVRSMGDGTAVFNIVGDRGQALKIVYAKGGEKTMIVSLRDAEELAAAIESARASKA